MRVEIRAPDMLDERRIVFGESPLDLLEDALFVIAQWHSDLRPPGRDLQRRL
jgi:hypothetical protein